MAEAPEERSLSMTRSVASRLDPALLGRLDLVLVAAAVLPHLLLPVGDMGAARRVFNGMLRRETVAWNAVIGGYVRAGCLGEAVGLFNQMRSVDGAQPTKATLVSLISGYADFGSWKGRDMLHAAVVMYGFHCSLFACNALLEAYAEFSCFE